MRGLPFDGADPRPATGRKSRQYIPTGIAFQPRGMVPPRPDIAAGDWVETWTCVRVAVLKGIAEAFNSFLGWGATI
jgi:hypothetical protein